MQFDVEVDGEAFDVRINPVGSAATDSIMVQASEVPKAVKGGITSTMQGTVLKIKVKKGDKIKTGDILLTIEAMKMEQEISADRDGEIKEIFVKEGGSVKTGDLLMQII